MHTIKKNSQTIGMKKIKIRSSLLVGAATLLFSFSTLKTSELTDIAKPYLGVYDCTQAQFGEENLLDTFNDLKLELKGKGEYVLYYKESGKKTKRIKGKYRYDKDSESITLCLPNGPSIRRNFPLQKGVLTITVPYKNNTLHLQFEQK